jgi:hypothetical protein
MFNNNLKSPKIIDDVIKSVVLHTVLNIKNNMVVIDARYFGGEMSFIALLSAFS